MCALVLSIVASGGCLVLGLDRFYDEPSIEFDERLLGTWRDVDDNVSVTVERSDWRSYRLQYVHPTERGTLTGYLFKRGSAVYLDLVAVRGQDLGSFVLPAHGLVRLTLGADPAQVTIAPLSYDWFARELAEKTLPSALRATKGERDQIVLAAARAELQLWLASRPTPDPAFGQEAVFRKN